jgi:hypothetical protein
MSTLKGKVFLWSASIALLGCALPAVAQQKNLKALSDITPQYQLVYCDPVPPNGYVWVGTVSRASCGSVGHAMVAFVYESYFDKPVGTSLQLCSPNFVPPGWYIVNQTTNLNCSAPTARPATQWIIERFE